MNGPNQQFGAGRRAFLAEALAALLCACEAGVPAFAPAAAAPVVGHTITHTYDRSGHSVSALGARDGPCRPARWQRVIDNRW